MLSFVSYTGDYAINILKYSAWAEGAQPPMGNGPSEMVYLKAFAPDAFDTLPVADSWGQFCLTEATGGLSRALLFATLRDSKGDGEFPCGLQGYIARCRFFFF